jgi:hypothetical protein
MTGTDPLPVVPAQPGTRAALRPSDVPILKRPGSTDDAWEREGEHVTVAAAQTVNVRLVVEPQNGHITGTVVDADGKPVADAYVAAARESDAAGAQASSVVDTRWGDDRPALTATDGRFTLGPFASGNYTLRAYRKGGGEAIAEHVAVGSNAHQRQSRSAGSIRPVPRRMSTSASATCWSPSMA